MSSDDEKAAIQARLYESIKKKGPGWQDACLELFLLKAGDPPAPEYGKTVEREARSGPPTTPPVIYLPGAVTSEADTSRLGLGSGTGSPATLSRYMNTSEKFLSIPAAGTIGQVIDTGELLSISDTARRSGLYVLGRSGSGKTELLKRMILSDIDRGHGVFFVDPHGDAIDDLITRLPSHRIKDVISIDPDLESDGFGINLLSCNNIASWSEREVTYNRAKAVFDKLWKNMPEELPWLQLIIEHTLPVFIYNPEYTLAEVPLFYKDADFRRFLLRSVTQDPEIVDFWQTYFHQKQADAAMTRVWTLLGRPPVKDIVSQQKSTIDFARILKERQILFVKLSAGLSADTKKFIGTILISQLLHAVRKRAEIAEGERHQFCIFVDEFQHFTASDDFATLINEARKFGIATTVAHQERVGQFADDKKLLGATDAAGNKILFQLGGKDAEEQALEFAVKPPTETRREEQYALSQNPVSELLARGHIDPDIRMFINKYLRYLDDKRDDIKADMEGVKFARMIELDTAAIYGAEAQGEGIAGPSHYAAQAEAVSARQVALLRARMHSIKLAALHEHGNLLRVTMRQLNRFLTEVMEGARQAKQEEFADFLINLASSYSALPEEYAQVLGLYIKVSYGDPGVPRTIPFDLAKWHFLFPEETFLLTCEALKKTEDERREFKERFIPEEVKDRALARRREREARPRDRLRAMEGKIVLINRRLGDIRGGRTGTRGDNMNCPEDLLWYPANVYTWFVWLKNFADIEKLLLPYRTAKFTKNWKDVLAEGDAVKTIIKLDEALTLVKAWEYGSQKYMEFMRARVVRDLKQFLHRYQEGALVMLALADCAGKGGWRFKQDQDISLTGFPGIEGQDPAEVWCLIERLRVVMRGALGGRRFSSLFSKYFNEYPEYSYEELDNKLDWAGFQTSVGRQAIYDDIKYRKDVEALEALTGERWGWFVSRYARAGEWWKKIDAPVRYYLLCRAADQISFGERYQSLPAATCAPYEEVVSALVSLSKETKLRLEEAEEKEAAERERQRIEKECAEKVGKISYSPPELLEPRVLGPAERQAVREACIKEIREGPEVVSKVAGTIDAFAKFCELLSKPENHIKVKTGQYVERQVNTRSEADMVNEKARELVELPIFMAYARVRQEMGGEQGVFKGKIRTLQLPYLEVAAAQEAFERNRVRVEENSRGYLKPRDQIRVEIEKRQERWRGRVADGEPAAQGDEKRGTPVDGGGFPGPDPDKEPPPGTRYKSGR